MPLPDDASPTKRAIWEAASRLFAADGYARTSVRDIAAEAGADPALVIRHFGSKEALFLDTMSLDVDPQLSGVLDGPPETMGERYIGYLLDAGEDVRGVFLALLRGSEHEGIGGRLRIAHDEGFVAPLLTRLEGPDAEARARTAAALVGGFLYSTWVVEDDRLAALGREELVRRFGPLLQSALDGPRAGLR